MSPIKNYFNNGQLSTKGDPCWAPPVFPDQGRLTLTIEQMEENFKQITEDERKHQTGFPKENSNPCCKSLHISLFFDGTNNNEPNDSSSIPSHPSNVAKLYHACAPESPVANEKGFYAYYIPGVGTPFPQIGTYDYYSSGLQFAVGGEDRINWGLVQVCNTLYHAVTKKFIGNGEMKKAVEEMNSSPTSTSLLTKTFNIMAATSPTNYNRENINKAYLEAVDPNNNNQSVARLRVFKKLLTQIRENVTRSQCKILPIKLFVYGFSRGAAEARAFASWLNEVLSSGPLGFPVGTLLGIKVSIEFLGLFDTVPAVGIANVVPGFTGHNGWAGQTQPLPKSGLIKKCCHFVAAHEQRQAFSLDSIRTAAGNYLPNSIEVVYPGMHSDVGGGYSIDDQGKSRDDASDLLSQIPLHDMYAAAIEAGAPLSIHPSMFALLMPKLKQKFAFREMNATTVKEFDFSPNLVNTFNHWLSTTLTDNQQEEALSSVPIYLPCRLESICLEQVVETQIIWITGWRIARFASAKNSAMNISAQTFFQYASQHPKIKVQPYEQGYSQQAQDALAEEWSLLQNEAKKTVKERQNEIYKHSEDKDWFPSKNFIGDPLFDANNTRGQLWEAALEFEADYNRKPRPLPLFKPENRKTKDECIIDTQRLQSSNSSYFIKEGITTPFPTEHCNKLPEYSFDSSVSTMAYHLQKIDPLLARTAYIYTYQNEAYEYLRFKQEGRTKFEMYFKPYLEPPLPGMIPDSKIGALINLFDNYIHDSRAWFMHSESGVREPFGSYFLSRMIYFGDKWNKAVQLSFDGKIIYGVDQNLQDMAVFAHHPTYGVKLYHRTTGQEIIIDESRRPAPTYELIAQLSPLVKQQKQERKIIQSEKLQMTINRMKV